MNQYQIAIVALLIAHATTLYLLWEVVKRGEQWRTMWTRDSAELLYWKRNGILRDPLTGKYRKKDKR